jgi:SPP1 gp7 family putative phage head morphogenesis protein
LPLDYLSETIKMAVELRRLENGLAAEIGKDFDSSFAEVLKTLDVTDNPQTRRAIVMKFQDEFASQAKTYYEQIGKLQTRGAILIAEKQGKRTAKAMAQALGKSDSSVSTISRTRLKAILDGDAIDGLTVKEWHKRNQANLQKRIRIQTNLGLANNESLAEIKERVEKFALQPAKRHAETLARTSTNNLANAACYETAEASGLSKGYRWKVTLDGRTSKICISYAAKNRVYPYAPSSPRPPAHFNCRSRIMPVLVGREDLDIPEDGEGWFTGLSKETQDDVLGPRRADLFRRDKIKLEDLVRSDGTSKSIPELRGASSGFQI